MTTPPDTMDRGVELVRGTVYGGFPPGTYRAEHPREVELHQQIVYAKTQADAEAATARWREHINARRRKQGLPEIPLPGTDRPPAINQLPDFKAWELEPNEL